MTRKEILYEEHMRRWKEANVAKLVLATLNDETLIDYVTDFPYAYKPPQWWGAWVASLSCKRHGHTMGMRIGFAIEYRYCDQGWTKFPQRLSAIGGHFS